MIGTVILLISIWWVSGFMVDFTWALNKNCDGLELYNPYWAYKYYKNVK